LVYRMTLRPSHRLKHVRLEVSPSVHVRRRHVRWLTLGPRRHWTISSRASWLLVLLRKVRVRVCHVGSMCGLMRWLAVGLLMRGPTATTSAGSSTASSRVTLPSVRGVHRVDDAGESVEGIWSDGRVHRVDHGWLTGSEVTSCGVGSCARPDASGSTSTTTSCRCRRRRSIRALRGTIRHHAQESSRVWTRHGEARRSTVCATKARREPTTGGEPSPERRWVVDPCLQLRRQPCGLGESRRAMRLMGRIGSRTREHGRR
jgi:hypothetical protein